MVNTVLCGIFGMITSNAWSYHLVVVVVAVHVRLRSGGGGHEINNSFCCISEDKFVSVVEVEASYLMVETRFSPIAISISRST